MWGWTEVKGSAAGANVGSQRQGSGSTWWLKAGKGSRGSQEGARLQNRLLGAEKRPGKCSWKALPEVLEEAWALSRKRLKECSSCGCGHWAVSWVRTAGRASLDDRRAVLLK